MKKQLKNFWNQEDLSLEEGDGVDLEDIELAHCYAVLGDKEKAEEHMKLALDALGTYAEEEHLKKQFDEIKEMINVFIKTIINYRS